jgi:membrane protein DedA with SNARE-associated domain
MTEERSIPDLMGEVLARFSELLANEFALARAELAEKTTQAGKAAALIGAGAILIIPALVLILMAIAGGLIEAGLAEPLSYLLTGGLAALLAAVLMFAGARRLSGEALKPSVTLDQINRDKIAAKEMVR